MEEGERQKFSYPQAEGISLDLMLQKTVQNMWSWLEGRDAVFGFSSHSGEFH